MAIQKQDIDQRWQTRATHIYLMAAALEGFVAFILLIRIPGDPRFAWLLGLSQTRWVMFIGILLGACSLAVFERLLFYKSDLEQKLLSCTTKLLRSDLLYYALVTIAFVFVIFAGHFLWLTAVLTDALVHGYLERLMPVVLWLGLVSFQTIIALPILRYGKPQSAGTVKQRILRTSIFAFAALLLLSLFVAITGIGITPDANGWGTPGAPIPITQVWLVVGLGSLFLLGDILLGQRGGDHVTHSAKFDIFMSVLLWSVTFGIWIQEPLNATYFSPAPRAPSYEYFPYSDAAYYDSIAHQLMIGEGFPGISMKPLYTMFLAAAHIISGHAYNDLIIFQIGVLAFLPVAIYWLTKTLHHRVSALLAAGFIILREKNAIALSGKILVSHSKLLMSDQFATLGIVFLILLILIWLRTNRSPGWLPILLGGILGGLSLLRPQMIVLTLAIILLFIVIFYRRPLTGVINTALFFLGLGLILFPWLWRSREITGYIVINSPNQMAWMTQVYHLNPGTYYMRREPGETQGEYANRINRYLKQFIVEHPKEVASFTLSHFMHNEVSMIVSLPMSWQLTQNPNNAWYYFQNNVKNSRLWEECCSVNAYVNEMPFWESWQGRLNRDMVYSVALNMLIIAIGLSVSISRRDILGWVPLGFGLTYNMSVALGRYSGWRFLLPMDWVTFLYYAIGLGQLVLWGFSYIAGNDLASKEDVRGIDAVEPETQRVSSRFLSGIAVCIILLILGLVPLLIESWVPVRYSRITKHDAVSVILTTNFYDQMQQMDALALDEFINSERVVALEGRALYPRYYPIAEGEPGGDWQAYKPRDYNRLGFTLVGPQGTQIVLRLDEPPASFPNASDVVVLGCQMDGYVDAWVVILEDRVVGNTTVQSVWADALICPLP